MFIRNSEFKIRNLDPRSALTLVELVIYVAIFAIVAGIFVSVLTTSVQSNNQEVAANEVTSQLNFVLNKVQQLVQQSSQAEIYASLAQSTSTAATSTGSFLKLRMNSTSTDPTCIYLSGNTIWETQGATPNASSTCNLSNAVALTTSKVLANSLSFTQYNIPGGHTSVQLNAELTYNSTNPEFEITKAVNSAISRVSAATFDSDLLPNQNNTFNVGSSNYGWANGYFANSVTVGSSGSVTNPSLIRIEANSSNTGLTSDYPYLELYNGNTTANNYQSIGFTTLNTSSTLQQVSGIFGITTNHTAGSESGDLAFITRNNGGGLTEQMIIKGNGDVGIGTSTPVATLNVYAASAPVFLLNDNNSELRFLPAGGVNYIESGANSSTDSRADIRFTSMNGSTNFLAIQGSTGDVSIGTTSVGTLLTLAQNSTLSWVNGNSYTWGFTKHTNDLEVNYTSGSDPSAGTIAMYFQGSTGNVGIGGTTNPLVPLDVNTASTMKPAIIRAYSNADAPALQQFEVGNNGCCGGLFRGGLYFGAYVSNTGAESGGTITTYPTYTVDDIYEPIYGIEETGFGNLNFLYHAATSPSSTFSESSWQTAMDITSAGAVGVSNNLSVGGNLAVTGSITAGTKDFKITDPLNANDWLYHGSLEGPENGVIYHGEAQLKDGVAVVTLPDYFEALTMKTGRTVQLTPTFSNINEPVSELAAGPVVNGQFIVKAIDKNNPSQKFDWQVQAVRSDVPPLQVVQPKN